MERKYNLNSNSYRHALCHFVCYFVKDPVQAGGIQHLDILTVDLKIKTHFPCFSMQTRLFPSHTGRVSALTRAALLDIAAKEAEQLQVFWMLSIKLAYKQLVRL